MSDDKKLENKEAELTDEELDQASGGLITKTIIAQDKEHDTCIVQYGSGK